jgi:hypothetical protein
MEKEFSGSRLQYPPPPSFNRYELLAEEKIVAFE